MIFPLGAVALHVVLNGTPVRAYHAAYLLRGRVMAPLEPYITLLAASIETDGARVTVRRGDRFSEVAAYDGYIAIAPVLRALGAQVAYDPRTRVMAIRIAKAPPFATPTPFNRAVPQAPPLAIFTPVPQVTPRPVVSGKPVPRRTPLPVSVASPTP
ncbi:MAG: hypothetical protein ABR508_09900 [Candidatus Baltobacteraceae bacterium]